MNIIDENYETLMKEILNDTKMERYFHGLGKINIVKMSILSKVFYRLHAIVIKCLTTLFFFTKIERKSKIHMNCKKSAE